MSQIQKRGRCSWIYVLEQRAEPARYYIGMTVRLATRLREHVYTKRTKSTRDIRAWRLLAVYKYSHSERHDYATEKRITLAMMQLKGWASVKGAGFCRGEGDDAAGRKEPRELRSLPPPRVCGCGIPVALDRSKLGRSYSYCPRQRMAWLEPIVGCDVQVCYEGCKFFEWGALQ